MSIARAVVSPVALIGVVTLSLFLMLRSEFKHEELENRAESEKRLGKDIIEMVKVFEIPEQVIDFCTEGEGCKWLNFIEEVSTPGLQNATAAIFELHEGECRAGKLMVEFGNGRWATSHHLGPLELANFSGAAMIKIPCGEEVEQIGVKAVRSEVDKCEGRLADGGWKLKIRFLGPRCNQDGTIKALCERVDACS